MTQIRPIHSTSKASLSSQPRKETPFVPVQHKDTIQRANPPLDKPYEPSKPQLSLPRLVEYKLIASLERLRTVGASMLELNMQQLDECHEKFKEMQAENAQKFKESAERTQDSRFWAVLKKIGATVLAAISTVLGISLVATGAGTVIGGAMIASGLLTIANLAFTETGVWDWVAEKLAHDNEEKKKKIAAILPAAFGIATAVIGLAGSAGTLLWTSIDFTQKILVIAQTALSFAEGVASIGEGVARFRSLRTQAGLTEIKKDFFLNQNTLEKTTSIMEKWFQLQAKAAEQVSKIIRMSIHTNRRISTSAV